LARPPAHGPSVAVPDPPSYEVEDRLTRSHSRRDVLPDLQCDWNLDSLGEPLAALGASADGPPLVSAKAYQWDWVAHEGVCSQRSATGSASWRRPQAGHETNVGSSASTKNLSGRSPRSLGVGLFAPWSHGPSFQPPTSNPGSRRNAGNRPCETLLLARELMTHVSPRFHHPEPNITVWGSGHFSANGSPQSIRAQMTFTWSLESRARGKDSFMVFNGLVQDDAIALRRAQYIGCGVLSPRLILKQ
jgi:hypothetical protein